MLFPRILLCTSCYSVYYILTFYKLQFTYFRRFPFSTQNVYLSLWKLRSQTLNTRVKHAHKKLTPILYSLNWAWWWLIIFSQKHVALFFLDMTYWLTDCNIRETDARQTKVKRRIPVKYAICHERYSIPFVIHCSRVVKKPRCQRRQSLWIGPITKGNELLLNISR